MMGRIRVKIVAAVQCSVMYHNCPQSYALELAVVTGELGRVCLGFSYIFCIYLPYGCNYH